MLTAPNSCSSSPTNRLSHISPVSLSDKQFTANRAGELIIPFRFRMLLLTELLELDWIQYRSRSNFRTNKVAKNDIFSGDQVLAPRDYVP